MIQFRSSLPAGAVFCTLLLAVTPNFAQQIVRSAEPQHSIISLTPAPRPQGELLARHPGEATFAGAPASYHVFAAATAGKDAGVETLTLNFAGNTKLTRIQSKNKDFVIESGGTCHAGNVYERGQSCTLLVRFNPQGPGRRLGFITVNHSAEATPMSFGLTGNSYAPVVSFTPAVISTVAATVSSGTGVINGASNLAIDGGDVVYVADTANDLIDEVDPSGSINSFTPAFGTALSIAVDTFGDVFTLNSANSGYFAYYMPYGTEAYVGIPYTPGSCTPSTPCYLGSVGMYAPANLSIDAYDNLFFEDGNYGAAEMPAAMVSANPYTSTDFQLWYLNDAYAYTLYTPSGLDSFSVDAVGNLYTAMIASTCLLTEESLYDAEYYPSFTKVAGTTSCGFSGDGAQARGAKISSTIGQMAFDIAGNLYFADTGNQRVRRIDASTGIINTIAGNGAAGYTGDNGAATNAALSNPTGVAVDSQGQVYILSNAPSAGPTQVLRKVGTQGQWNFGSVLKGTSSLKSFTVSNTGNDTLTLAGKAVFLGANPTDYSVNPANTTCGLTAGASLAAGHSCTIAIAFVPSAGGARTATLQFPDNTVSYLNKIFLSGTGTLPAPTMTITSPTSGSSVSSGTVVTFAVSVTSSSSTKPTGTVTFKVNGTAIGGPVTLSTAGTASTTFTESTAKTYTLSAVYSGDANYATVTKSESLIVTAIKTPITVGVTVH